MKLTRFTMDKRESYGVQTTETQILDLKALSQLLNQPIPTSLDKLILLGEKGSREAERLIKEANDKDKTKATIRISKTRQLAPLASPPKIVCLGLNYRDHIAETNAAIPDDLIIFMKPRTSVVGPGDAIIKPSFVHELDYEAELAVIIGRRGKDIKAEDAKDHIFGYTCFNDVSARDIQFKDKQWTRGKSFDTFAPMGPCITTVDQMGDPTDLRIRTRVNGEPRQDSSTRNMVFNVYRIVHELSRVMTLEPCDVIATGTPAGVAFAMKPQQKFLMPGDIVEIEIEKIGVLRNRVVDHANAT